MLLLIAASNDRVTVTTSLSRVFNLWQNSHINLD